eukprot:scaffold237240_cov24-Tisochrysis_lutea.AAC.1
MVAISSASRLSRPRAGSHASRAAEGPAPLRHLLTSALAASLALSGSRELRAAEVEAVQGFE